MNAQTQLAPPIPISVVTGFLGSGKTSLLSRALCGNLSDTAVIINEIGAISLDHIVVKVVEGEVLTLPGGCLCCAMRQDVSRTLLDLLHKAHMGVIPPFQRVVIETSGLADPAPLLYTVASDPRLEGFVLNSVLTVVDSVFGDGALKQHIEARRQVAAADTILFSKTDLATPSEDLRLAIRSLNQRTDPIALALDDDPSNFLFVDMEGQRRRAAGWFTCEEVVEGQHSADIQSHAIALQRPVSRLDFAKMLGNFAAARGEDLLRMKGVIEFTDRPGQPAIINAVQHAIYPPLWLDAWPSADRRNRLVAIGHGLSANEILEAFISADPEPLDPARRAVSSKELQCSIS